MTDYLWLALFSLGSTLLVAISKLALLRRIGAHAYGSDSYFYLLYSDIIRKEHHRLPRATPILVGSSFFAIPFLLPWLASFVSRELLDHWQFVVPIVIKLIITFTLSIVTGLTLELTYGMPLMESGVAAFTAGILYGLAPINRNANPDNVSDYTFSPRSLGVMLASFSCLAAIATTVISNNLLWVMGVFLIALTCLTSKFAIQTIVFIIPITLGVLGAWLQILLIPAGVFLAVLMSRGYYWSVLIQQILHLKFYAQKLIKDHMAFVSSIFTTLDLFRFPWYLATGRLGSLRSLIRKDVILKGLFLYPIHIICISLLLTQPEYWTANVWSYAVGLLWISSMIVFILTSLPWFKFLGEADRYLEFVGFFPATVIVATWLFHSNGSNYLLSILIIATIASWYHILGDIFPAPNQARSEDENHFFELTAGVVKEGEKFVCIPLNDSPEFIYRVGIPCLWPFPLDQSNEHLIHKYPIPTLDFGRLSQQYGIRYVIVRSRFLKQNEVQSAVSELETITENTAFHLYRIS